MPVVARSQKTTSVQCHQCVDEHSDAQKDRFRMRQQQIELAESRGERHVGMDLQTFEKRKMDVRRQRNTKKAAQRAVQN
jgi:UPF0176 protein